MTKGWQDLGLRETVGGNKVGTRDKGGGHDQRQKGQEDKVDSGGARGSCGVTGGCLPCLLFAGAALDSENLCPNTSFLTVGSLVSYLGSLTPGFGAGHSQAERSAVS